MSPEENKDIVRRFQEGMMEAFRTGNLDVLLDTVHPDCAFDMPGMPPTVDGMKQALPAFRTAFPDMRVTVGEMLADGDKVAYRLTWTGTNTGEFMGIPATGKKIRLSGIIISRIADGKIAEEWENYDAIGMMRQLGRM